MLSSGVELGTVVAVSVGGISVIVGELVAGGVGVVGIFMGVDVFVGNCVGVRVAVGEGLVSLQAARNKVARMNHTTTRQQAILRLIFCRPLGADTKDNADSSGLKLLSFQIDKLLLE